MFPEYNRRSGRLYHPERSHRGLFSPQPERDRRVTGGEPSRPHATLPSPTSKEVLAVAAYLTWLRKGYQVGRIRLARAEHHSRRRLIPVRSWIRRKAKRSFSIGARPATARDGQGVSVGDKRPGPLWGPDSWNDGAGAARVYTLAGIIRHSMPYLNPGSLTDEEAQQFAAFINSKPRPAYPFKAGDYRTDKIPVDGVYYTERSN